MQNQLLMWVQNNIGITVIASITLIQITPIKINPWSYLCKVIGKMLNGELIGMFEEYKAEVSRYRIVRFADEIQHNEHPHTKDHYNQIMGDIDYYEKYCKDHPKYPNNKAITSIAVIKERYEIHVKENSFLK